MKVLMLRHTYTIGGAHIYNNLLERELSDFFDIYNGEETDLLSQKFIIPFYNGIRFYVFVYYFTKSLLSLFLLPKFFFKILLYEKIIFTSSIYHILAILISFIYPKKNIFLIIQENINIKNYFFKFLLIFSSNIKFITISDSLNSFFLKKNIFTFYLPNYIDITRIDIIDKNKCDFDLLYSGGDQNIKGFSNFLIILKSFNRNNKNKLSIALIGHYSQKNKELIAANCPSHIRIKNFGLVNNPLKYILNSRLIIIPIGNPHFCRIAIESGLLNKTFIIHIDLSNLDFVSDDNCFVIQKWENFSTFYFELDKQLIHDKSVNNFLFAKNWNNKSNIQMNKIATFIE